jgi:1-acyl-sn-glycerol-3-phosphate acyltransferase
MQKLMSATAANLAKTESSGVTRSVPVSACAVARSRKDRPAADSNPHRRPEDRLLIRLLQAVDVCVARIYHQTIVRAPQRLPRHGPAILICNHTSGLDPLLIQSVCPRLIVWMMAKEYYEIKALNWIFRMIEVIPVDRGGRDLAATRSALRALEAGRILGVFPEGRIETTRDLLPFQTGVALMAIKSDVPVYPAYLDGTQRNRSMWSAFFSRNRATLAFGPAVEFDRSATSKDMLQTATERMTDAVSSLKARVERADAGKRPNDRRG